jgi:hypothetical protein
MRLTWRRALCILFDNDRVRASGRRTLLLNGPADRPRQLALWPPKYSCSPITFPHSRSVVAATSTESFVHNSRIHRAIHPPWPTQCPLAPTLSRYKDHPPLCPIPRCARPNLVPHHHRASRTLAISPRLWWLCHSSRHHHPGTT